MSYRFVNISRNAIRLDAESHQPRYLCVDGRPLVPGAYASVVTELPASQTADGRPLARGFYAVLWPMDERSPRLDENALYFGPFSSGNQAEELVRDASADAVAEGVSIAPIGLKAAGGARGAGFPTRRAEKLAEG